MIRIMYLGRTYLKHIALVCATTAALLSSPLSAQMDQARSPVTNAQVVLALQGAQIPVEGVEIKMAAAISSSSPNAELEITGLSPVNSRTMRLRLDCKHHGQCIPFYASVAWPDKVPSDLDQALKSGKLAKANNTIKREPTGDTRKAQESIIIVGRTPEQFVSAMKSGHPATLLIEDGRIHIRLQVICLQSGITGDKVRVTTSDHKQSYLAEVIAPNLLRGSL